MTSSRNALAPYVFTMQLVLRGSQAADGNLQVGDSRQGQAIGVLSSCGATASPHPHGQGLKLGLQVEPDLRTSSVPRPHCHGEGGTEVTGLPTSVGQGLPTTTAKLPDPAVSFPTLPLCWGPGRAVGSLHFQPQPRPRRILHVSELGPPQFAGGKGGPVSVRCPSMGVLPVFPSFLWCWGHAGLAQP